MNLWILLLAFSALAECFYQTQGAHSCPDLCSCSFSPLGAEVECSQSLLTHFPEEGLPSNTTRLSIQSTDLRGLTAQHLSAVPLLKHLQLYHTNLTSLPADLLKNVPHLNKLDLTGNQLVRLPPDIFSHASLRSLLLMNNQIEEMDAEWFPLNSSLTSLDLSGNRLTAISAAFFQKMPSLEDLDLSNNNLHDIQPDHLKNLHHLERLNLGSNKLSSLQPTTFSNNLKLSHLFLNQNQLRDLPGSLLRGLEHLELVMLNQNQLQSLPYGLLDERKDDFRVVLSGNPWVCDKRMAYLWKWLSANADKVFFLEDVTCAEPEAVRQRQLAVLSETELELDKTEE